jgi:putative transcriptional regulator
MSEVSESIMRGLEEALEYTRGARKCRTMKITFEPLPEYAAADIRRIRTGANMTQLGFAEFLGVSAKAVEAWENGRNKPNGSARRLMSVAESDPSFPSKYYAVTEKYGYIQE